LAFEFNKMKIDAPKTEGLVAFFDIMGFSEMISNNELKKSTEIILEIFHRAKNEVHQEFDVLIQYNLIPELFIFSDSILAYQIPTLHNSPELTKLSSSCFVKLCGRLTAELLKKGLPARGAISKGKFSIIDGKTFAGKCIMDAHALSEKLQLAGCAVVPPLESEFSKDVESNDWIYWQALLKDLSTQKLLMLNFLNYMTEPAEEISQTYLREKFSEHGKGFNPKVLTKVIETDRFLMECKKHVKSGGQNI